MFFQRYYLQCLSHASYVIADEETKEAVVVDPRRDIDIYVDDAKQARIHNQARDSHALPCRLRSRPHRTAEQIRRTNLPRSSSGGGVRVSRAGRRRRDSIRRHSTRDALETPGHTPEGLSLRRVSTWRKRPTNLTRCSRATRYVPG